MIETILISCPNCSRQIGQGPGYVQLVNEDYCDHCVSPPTIRLRLARPGDDYVELVGEEGLLTTFTLDPYGDYRTRAVRWCTEHGYPAPISAEGGE